jgi:1-acyl-sn-glycerol-3-phosphate acyltransferase
VTTLRSAVFNVWMVLLTFGMAAWGNLLRLIAPDMVYGVARCWARMVVGSARVMCGITVKVTGLDTLPATGPMVLASQHQSAFDTAIWLAVGRDVSYVVKAELGRVPLFGALLRPAHQVLVNRSAGATALRHMVADAADRVRAGRTIVIFPQGTRTQSGVQVPIQPGIAALAARLRLPIFPVATDSGRLWGRRAFRKEPGCIHITIGAPLPPDLPRAVLVQRLQQSWDALLPPVDNSVHKSETVLFRNGTAES